MLSKLQTLKEEREQGFTLIELLVVILIIGILSAIAIPAFMNQRKSAVDSSVQSDVSNAAKQIETAAVKAGSGIIELTGAGSTVVAGTGIVTITPSTASTVNTPIVTQVSDGTVLTFTGNTRDGYTVKGTNEGGDVSHSTKGTGFTYNSLTGGF